MDCICTTMVYQGKHQGEHAIESLVLSVRCPKFRTRIKHKRLLQKRRQAKHHKSNIKHHQAKQVPFLLRAGMCSLLFFWSRSLYTSTPVVLLFNFRFPPRPQLYDKIISWMWDPLFRKHVTSCTCLLSLLVLLLKVEALATLAAS